MFKEKLNKKLAAALSEHGFEEHKELQKKCIPKINGIPANINWEEESAFFKVITPTVERATLAVKLAVAEKHIFY